MAISCGQLPDVARHDAAKAARTPIGRLSTNRNVANTGRTMSSE